MKRIGVIGLGTMGLPMALNLLKAGFEVCGFNRTPAKAQQVAKAGGEACVSVAELVGKSEVVITMLANDAAVKEIILGDDGVAASGRAGLIVIDCSTVSPTTSREVAAALAKRGIRHLDAPVTGSKKQAEDGSLSFLVGGDRGLFDACASLFAAMGKKKFYLGGTGMGASAKLCNNMVVAMNMAALSEGMALASRCGINLETMLEIFGTSGARGAMAELKGPKLLRGDTKADFALALMKKDTGLAQQLAEQAGQPAPLLATTHDVFAKAVQELNPDLDFCTVFHWYMKK
jgi:3-hydroxyisobutyrate dehydrogenase-like beta-hydroxyacid dehydrogenase